jgi:hypothetical protein
VPVCWKMLIQTDRNGLPELVRFLKITLTLSAGRFAVSSGFHRVTLSLKGRRGNTNRTAKALVRRPTEVGAVVAETPNPSIEGMPKRLRLLCTPHVKR